MSEQVLPVVLVGGKSQRFGRDKLREPIGTARDADGDRTLLIDVAIGALRAVFGSIVAVVGECDPAVAVRADRVIVDTHVGVGPMGGVLSATEACGSTVLVLPGDLCIIDSTVIPALLSAASAAPRASAILAKTDHVQWCVGVYRPRLAPLFRAAIDTGQTALRRAVPGTDLVTVDIDPAKLRDADRPEDLAAP